jgi:hypothetical protein
MNDTATPLVWAIGESFRIDPLTGLAREEQRLDGNPLPGNLDYQRHSTVWDAAAGQVSLQSARNEVVAYQLQIAGPARDVSVACSDLVGPATIRAEMDIEVLRQWYTDVTENSTSQGSTTAAWHLGTGWYADALIPLDSGECSGQTFHIPDRENAVPGQRWQGIWIDIYVARDVPAGTYTGTVTVTGEGLLVSLEVELKVHDVTLSDDFTCEVGLNNYGSIGKKGSDLRLRYYQMAHRHRMAIHEHYIQTETTGAGADMRGVWDAYDAEMGKYLSGKAFTAQYGYRGPGEGKPLRWIYLPVEILSGHAWPLPAEQVKESAYDEAVVAMTRDFSEHFAAKGWTSTDMMFFVNGLDEPTSVEQVEDIRYFGDLCREAEADRVFYRADLNHLHDIDRFDFDYTEQKLLDKLGPVVDLWVCVGDFQRTDFAVLLPRRQPPDNDVVWFYQNREPSVGGYTLDDETIGLRTWPVISWKYGLDGCVLWELTFTGASQDIWRDPRNSVDRELVHNLAGLLAYPARPGIDEPVTSIRMKNFRRGAQDYEYLRILESLAGREAAEAILDPLVPSGLHRPERPYGAAGAWSHNPEDWHRVRLDLLEAITAASS